MIVGHIGGGSVGVDTGDIPASLRLRSAASANLTKTLTGGSQTTCTHVFWLKKSENGRRQVLIGFSDASANAWSIEFNASDQLEFGEFQSSTWVGRKITNAVYRDPTAWLMVVCIHDTTNAVAADRMQIWVNGVRVTSFSTSTDIPQNTLCRFDGGYVQTIGNQTNGAYYLNGCLARVCRVSGQALTPSSFGYLNTEINEWVSKSQAQVKAVVDSGGVNSFMLDYDDATSLTTLGYDKSSKGNNWTLNNFSLTAGMNYDWTLDVPGNSFAIFNPLDRNTAVTFGNANLAVTSGGATVHRPFRSSMVLPKTGKWYWETMVYGAYGQGVTGIATPAASLADGAYVGQNTQSWGYFGGDGKKYTNAVGTAYGSTYGVNTVIGHLFDADAGTLSFTTAGVSQGVAFSGLTSADYIPICSVYADSWTANFGQMPFQTGATYDSASGGYFRYAPPTGYKALCQRNMPDPAILNPEKHFDVVTYTGTAATKSITGLLFGPGLVEMKSRGRALDWAYYDIVRGVEKRLESNNTDAEVTGDTTGLTAFNSDGWTMGALDQINGTTATNSFVGYAWKAGGTPVTNNAGSISSQVSANVEAGFSIVTYTGTGANATVGHGLGKAPGLVIVRNRNAVASWGVYHASLGATNYILLNTTAAQVTNTMWNNTAPTSSVFSLGGAGFGVNDSTINAVAYCFAEIPGFSKIFSYTGNGSADGPYVELGLKAKYVLVKGSSLVSEWYVWDAARNTYNVMNMTLNPNQSAAEYSAGSVLIDATSSGFKVRDAVGSWNSSGQTYIGIAFADVPAKYSLAR